jgi:hypothetical protein
VAIRFHLDENIAPGVAIGLRFRGIDATTTNDAGLAGAGDLAQLSFAAASGRVIVTQDDDFLRLHSEGIHHAGIVFCLGKGLRESIRGSALIHDLLSPHEMDSRVDFL